VAVTLRDVAAHVGVSPRTVSNVVNNFRYVSPATRILVQAAIDELDYRPNLLARSLRQGRTAVIGFLLPELDVPYFSELAHEMVEHAHTLGLTVLIDETTGSQEREVELLSVLARARQVDGIILSAIGLSGRRLAELRPTLPLVLLGERTTGSTVDHVTFDNVEAARQLVKHLIDQGRRRIAVIAAPASPGFATSNLRMRGCQSALWAAGVPYLPELTVRTPRWHRTEGYRAMAELLDRPNPPDAVVAFNDVLAIGALRLLHERGISVPQRIAVTGFDNIEDSRFSIPTLTTAGPEKADVARRALDVLVERIAGHTGPPRAVALPFSLQLRDSSLSSR
jgi:LacI family repressor for deo operon, udp, cdd, tsx, nupC, and nupG